MSDLNQPVRETPAERAAREFRQMSERVLHNLEHGFGGAFVVVDPNGNVKQMLVLNAEPDAALFWSNAETACKIAGAELENSNPMNPRQPQWR